MAKTEFLSLLIGGDLLMVAPDDDVAVALAPVGSGVPLDGPAEGASTIEAIPQGHKVAVRMIAAGAPVMRYRTRIGVATAPIAVGEHVHSHNLKTCLSGENEYSYAPQRRATSVSPAIQRHFLGYNRGGGIAATRNDIWIIPTVGCVARLGERLAVAAGERHRGRIDGVHAFAHPLGCSQLGDDLASTAAILAALAQHPNAGGVLLIGLGCESNQLGSLLDRIPAGARTRIATLRAQESVDDVGEAMAMLDALAEQAATAKRTAMPLAALRLGLKCGGSDAMSGLTANPLIGRMADIVTDAGGTALLTEVPEIFGAEQLLMERCADRATFDRLVTVTNRFKRYFLDEGQPVSENPSPGNIAGGITTLEEKSLGAVQKGGVATVTDVLDYGERLRRPGLSVLEAPGNDSVSTTALAAAGATLTLFSTGRGTPLGSPVPTLKLASTTALATRKPGWIDFDAGRLLRDGPSIAADALLDLVIATASGAPARNEINEERSIGLWKRGVTL